MGEASWVMSRDLSEAQLGMCFLEVPTGQTGGAEEASRGKVLCPGRKTKMEMVTGKMTLKMHSASRDQGQGKPVTSGKGHWLDNASTGKGRRAVHGTWEERELSPRLVVFLMMPMQSASVWNGRDELLYRGSHLGPDLGRKALVETAFLPNF